MSEDDRMLALIADGEREAAQALEDLKALWAREDDATAANRAKVLEAHEQGTRDREEARLRYGGAPVEDVKPKRAKA